MKRTLDSAHRATLRALILGTIQHCEISRHLIGTIPHTFEENGIQYGVPSFTFFGPPDSYRETRMLGLMAGRRSGDGLSAEVALQVIERLLIQPGIATGLWLRILPVINPVGLENPESEARAYTPAEERLSLDALDGVIEVATTQKDRLTLGLRSDWDGLPAGLAAYEDMQRLSTDLGDIEYERVSATQLPYNARSPWHLYLGLPRTWGAAEATHLASQFLLCFFRRWQEQTAASEAYTIH